MQAYLRFLSFLQIVHLYKDPQGTTVLDEDEQSMSKLPSLTTHRQSVFSDSDKEDEIVKLRRRVAVLEKAQSEQAQPDQAVKVDEVTMNTAALEANQELSSVGAI